MTTLTRSLVILLLLAAACATPTYEPRSISVVEPSSIVGSECDLVGELPFEITRLEEKVNRQTDEAELRESLLRSAKHHAELYDADLLVFSAISNPNPKYVSLSCDCKAYRCDPPDQESTHSVSLADLIRNPESYYGRFISVEAWGAIHLETIGLFGSPETLESLSFERAVELWAPESAFSHIPYPYTGRLYVKGVFKPGVPYRGYGGLISVYHVEVRE